MKVEADPEVAERAANPDLKTEERRITPLRAALDAFVVALTGAAIFKIIRHYDPLKNVVVDVFAALFAACITYLYVRETGSKP